MPFSSERFTPWRPPALEDLTASAAAPATAPAAFAAVPWAPGELAAAAHAAVAEPDTERAWREGFEQGARSGAAEAEALLKPAAEALHGVVARLDGAEAAFARDRVQHLEALAVAIARRLIQRELDADPARVRELIVRALELVPREAMVQVRLHPLDLDAVRTAGEFGGSGAVSIEWLPDPELERGGFVLETPQRVVDGRADVALRALFERLEHA